MLRRTRLLALATLTTALALAPTVAAADGDRDVSHRRCERSLAQASMAFDDAFVARDLDAFMAFVHDDAVQVDYLGNVFANKAEIAEFTAAVMANEFTFTHTLITQTINKCASAHVVQDTVFAIPGLELHLLDAVTWIRVRGEWKVSFIQNTQFA